MGSCRLRHARLLSDSKWPYIAAIVFDLFARVSFVYTLIPTENMMFDGTEYSFLRVAFFLSPTIEIIRRMMWSVYMIEFKWLQQLEQAGKKEALRLVNSLTKRKNVASMHVKSRFPWWSCCLS
eukprot:SRR837773.14314.p2 GENE.SRR837773.14314~~SRR837773.14314.p2  ORF type:complete len:133 (+),score=36.02 SRR837773.14314:32-400(+)